MLTQEPRDVYRKLDRIADAVEYHGDERKVHLQALSDSEGRRLASSEARLVLTLGLMALAILLPSTLVGIRRGFATSAILVGIVVVGHRCWLSWTLGVRTNRVARFRERFRELLGRVPSRAKEDYAFLRGLSDSILFPALIPYEQRRRVSADDLWQVETLYIEYCRLHCAGASPQKQAQCPLCASADRVRRHIEQALNAADPALSNHSDDPENESRFDFIRRRIVGRLSPEALFREWEARTINMRDTLHSLAAYGYDPKLVETEYRLAQKLVLRERDQDHRDRAREFATMQTIFRMEDHRVARALKLGPP